MSIVGEDIEAWDAKKIAVERPTSVVTMSNEYVGYPPDTLHIISHHNAGELLEIDII